MDPLNSVRGTITAGFVVAILLSLLITPTGFLELGLARWLHILSGVMWIGLLWYFNFVQIPSIPKIPDEQKPAISKVIAPQALC